MCLCRKKTNYLITKRQGKRDRCVKCDSLELFHLLLTRIAATSVFTVFGSTRENRKYIRKLKNILSN